MQPASQYWFRKETASAKPSSALGEEELFLVHLHRETPEYLLADRDGLEISLRLPLLDKFANLLYYLALDKFAHATTCNEIYIHIEMELVSQYWFRTMCAHLTLWPHLLYV
jgi:hypothetical protein